ncbi:PHD finger protein 14 [Tetranychus urticae]|uniref:PHD finger protein 14 n=1 Tax=Tetranychus urticae TaxID=32264 RepID=T1KAJ1_TETUR|nr:PHD finger protein 14 [Tetranychus urticae]
MAHSSLNLLVSDLLAESSSDDEEYVPKSKDIAAAEKDDIDDDDEDDDEDDDDEDPDAEDDDDDENKGHRAIKEENKSTEKSGLTADLIHSNTDYLKSSGDFSPIKFELPIRVTKLLVCSVCLGDVSHEVDEIVECDSCGITVHEACYGVTNDTDNDADSVNSNASSASTEPWFCDACLANVTNPNCDLCPNVGGIFKQTDVKRWVHLVCALYIPGVAFNDTSHLSGVTLFELSHDRWSARTCILCEDERLSRTGVCISCDAGMCKSYFHVSCAQSHGLLSEAQTADETELVDPFYAHCKVHASDKAVVKSKRRNWLALQSKMKIKRQQLQENSLNERIARKLQRARIKWLKIEEMKQPPWVPNQKIPRLLTTSPSAVKKLIRKAELLGMSPQTQYIAAQDVDIRKKWHLPPAFSVEYVSYYLDRDNRITNMQKRIEELKNQCRQLKGVENTTRQRYEELINVIGECKTKNTELKETGRNIWTLLANLSRETISIPKLFQNDAEKRDEESKAGGAVGESATSAPNILVKCGICNRSHDFQRLALCDSCKLHYHLYCLDPPLKRMPKKTRFGGWQCSDCTEKEEEETTSPNKSDGEQSPESSIDTPNKRRRLRENVKGPNKFVPDAETTPTAAIPKKKKRGRKRKRIKGVRRNKIKIKKEDDEENSANRRGIVSMGPNNSLLVTLEPVKPVKLEEECCKCKQISKTKFLVQCDQCFLFYHFACCNPPLRKNPKKKGYQWFCEECDDSDESDEEDDDDGKDETGEGEEEEDAGEGEDSFQVNEKLVFDFKRKKNYNDDSLKQKDTKNNNRHNHHRPHPQHLHQNHPYHQHQSQQHSEMIIYHENMIKPKENGRVSIHYKENGD